LRDILQACECDIARQRALRQACPVEWSTSGGVDPREYVERQFGGILPPREIYTQRRHRAFFDGMEAAGGVESLRDRLYPVGDTIFPYYLAILIHTAGNPEAIAALRTDCLQPLPLLTHRVVLVWEKARAGRVQRRTFRSDGPFEPPTLVREILEWTRWLRARAPPAMRERLFLYWGGAGVTSLPVSPQIYQRRRFSARHSLPEFPLASIRPSVLTAFYRASGDLSAVRGIANHARLSTTAEYVEGPLVAIQNQEHIANLQHEWLGQLKGEPHLMVTEPERAQRLEGNAASSCSLPPGGAVSMWGFDCRDPLAGVAPGSHKGELCASFLGCLTCPNAVLGRDSPTLARLLQARDHLRGAAAQIHPARFEAIYAPQLRILEEDILTRFSYRELAAARDLGSTLPVLPPLR
jgi:hypothetical protein